MAFARNKVNKISTSSEIKFIERLDEIELKNKLDKIKQMEDDLMSLKQSLPTWAL